MRLAVAWLCGAAVLLGAAAPAGAASPFAWRGVIEGPYGRPWDHGQRMRVLAFLAAHDMNAYVHAPKDDLYQRTQWRDPYPAAQQAEFDREIAFARARGVEWVPSLSPGLPLIPTPRAPEGRPSRDACYSCPADVDALVGKLAPFSRAGARTFMVSFDDVQKVLTHPEDTAAYGEGDAAVGRAHAEFLSRVRAALPAGSRLLTVAADYSGTADTDYLRAFRAALHPEVEAMWTGTAILARNFDPEEARAYARNVGRTPIVWDNWTVNDIDGNALGAATRIYLGPYARRANVVGAVSGFLLNPMNEADLNLLPFATAADFLRDPAAFDARASWLRAVRELGGDEARTLQSFAETSYSTALDLGTEAPTFVARNGALLASYRAGGGWVEERSELDEELARVRGAEAALRRVPALAPFAEQAAPFLAAARDAADVGRAASALLAAERPLLEVGRAPGGAVTGRAAPPDPAAAAALRGTLADRDGANRSSRRFVFGYRRPATIDTPPTPVPRNTMDVFAERVRDLDAAWQPVAAQAASSVRLTFDGRPVELGADGTFRLPEGASGVLEATDGAGGRTAVGLPAAANAPGAAAARRPRIVNRRARVRRGGRVRIVLRCPAPCAGVVRLRAGRRGVGARRLRRARAGRRVVHVRLRRPARRVRVLFPGARTVTITLARRR